MADLFRDEVVQAQRPQELGTISLAKPLSFIWWALLAAVLAAAIVLFLAFGRYTRRETVSGQLEPTAGMLTLSAKTTGTVMRVLVQEGEQVKAGQTLIEVSADLVSSSMGDTHAAIATQLRAQETQVRITLANLKPQADEQERELRARCRMVKAQLHQIDGQLALQREQAATDEQLLERVESLHQRGVVSTVQFDQYQAAALSAQVQVKALLRQRLDAEQQLSAMQSQMAQLPLSTAAKAGQLREQLGQLDAQLAQNAAQGGTVLRAPLGGIVSTLLVKPGQSVAIGQSVLSILPRGSKLEAQLLVPSDAIGFVAPGNPVVLRYQAFPYQRFGQQYGRVVQVSRSALTPAETESLLGGSQKAAASLYRVLVALDRQSISAYGREEPLKPGMALNADILLGSTSLWAWAFDPLRGLKEQMATAGDQRG